jgi:hypothetical protein
MPNNLFFYSNFTDISGIEKVLKPIVDCFYMLTIGLL